MDDDIRRFSAFSLEELRMLQLLLDKRKTLVSDMVEEIGLEILRREKYPEELSE